MVLLSKVQRSYGGHWSLWYHSLLLILSGVWKPNVCGHYCQTTDQGGIRLHRRRQGSQIHLKRREVRLSDRPHFRQIAAHLPAQPDHQLLSAPTVRGQQARHRKLRAETCADKLRARRVGYPIDEAATQMMSTVMNVSEYNFIDKRNKNNKMSDQPNAHTKAPRPDHYRPPNNCSYSPSHLLAHSRSNLSRTQTRRAIDLRNDQPTHHKSKKSLH